MPELPEVETIRLGLLGRVCNKRIEQVEIRCERIILRPATT
jgi:formamidopyrimidine-DNA glycosylase